MKDPPSRCSSSQMDVQYRHFRLLNLGKNVIVHSLQFSLVFVQIHATKGLLRSSKVLVIQVIKVRQLLKQSYCVMFSFD